MSRNDAEHTRHEESYAVIECRECHHVYLSLTHPCAREFGGQGHEQAQCDSCGVSDGKILRTGILHLSGPAPYGWE